MANRKLMVVHYTSDDDSYRLQTCLKMCCVPFVAFREYEFIGGGAFWKIYIDRGRLSWNEVMHEVNRVRSVKFCWVNDGSYIQDGKLYTPLIGGVLA